MTNQNDDHDSDPDDRHDSENAATVIATARRDNWKKKVSRATRAIPMFLYILIIFMIVETTVVDVRSVLFNFLGYKLTWVEVLYLVSSISAMAELLKVSRPGVDNTFQAICMAAVSGVYLILFTLGLAKTGYIRVIFSNTEFLMLLIFSITQTVMAFIINARTLKRTIDYGSSD